MTASLPVPEFFQGHPAYIRASRTAQLALADLGDVQEWQAATYLRSVYADASRAYFEIDEDRDNRIRLLLVVDDDDNVLWASQYEADRESPEAVEWIAGRIERGEPDPLADGLSHVEHSIGGTEELSPYRYPEADSPLFDYRFATEPGVLLGGPDTSVYVLFIGDVIDGNAAAKVGDRLRAADGEYVPAPGGPVDVALAAAALDQAVPRALVASMVQADMRLRGFYADDIDAVYRWVGADLDQRTADNE